MLPEWMTSWWMVAIAIGVIAVVVWAVFRSFRRWQQPPPRTPEQIQAEMDLFSESRQTDRW